MQSRRRRKKAARRRCARPIKAKPAPVRSSQSRGRAVVAEAEILRRGYDGHCQSEALAVLLTRAGITSQVVRRRNDGRADPADSLPMCWTRSSVRLEWDVAHHPHHRRQAPPPLGFAISLGEPNHGNTTVDPPSARRPAPSERTALQWESGRAPTGAAAIFRRLRQEAGTARAVPAPCRYSAATA